MLFEWNFNSRREQAGEGKGNAKAKDKTAIEFNDEEVIILEYLYLMEPFFDTYHPCLNLHRQFSIK